jgi:hypothetical protein
MLPQNLTPRSSLAINRRPGTIKPAATTLCALASARLQGAAGGRRHAANAAGPAEMPQNRAESKKKESKILQNEATKCSGISKSA